MPRTSWITSLSRSASAWLLLAVSAAGASGQAVPERLPPVRPTVPVEELPAPGPSPSRPPARRLWEPYRGWFDDAPWFNPFFEPAPLATGWLRVDYLNWHLRDAPLPTPLLTTSDSADAGRLGTPSTAVLYGGHSQNLGAFSGVRVSGGCWFTFNPWIGAEFSVFGLPGRQSHFQVTSSQTPHQLLALPFLNQTPGAAVSDSIVIAQPGGATASAAAMLQTSLWGIEGNALRRRRPSYGRGGAELAVLGGIRFIQLNERLDFSSSSTAAGGINRGDDIHTQSSFIGFQTGLRSMRQWGRLSFTATGKIAFGETNDLATVAGHYNSIGFGSPQPSLLPNGNPTTTPADIRNNYFYAFSVVPEVQAMLSYELLPRLRFSAGYDFLYWTRLIRPGNQIDTRADSANPASALAAPIQPVPLGRHSDFWLRGWRVSLTYHY
ncbi:MAG TPA: BBP7 family outer membrane beta-barrel protein [Pirellulales bacterium]|nr:BBP7 family outer membrane beta-barrel protein [Pirellulales bacterium]